jgi:hypothetical protein
MGVMIPNRGNLCSCQSVAERDAMHDGIFACHAADAAESDRPRGGGDEGRAA